MNLEQISVSSAETWDSCQMKWKLSREHKVPEDQKSVALRYGSAVHALAGSMAIDEFGAKCEDETRVESIPGIPYPPGFADRYNSDRTWVRLTLARLDGHGYELEVERKIELPAGSSKLPVPFVGYVDLLAVNKVEVIIADWKTTKRRRDRPGALQSLQLCAYTAVLSASQEFKGKAVECQLLFLDGQEVSRTTFDEARMEDSLQHLTRIAQEIIETAPEDCTPSPTRLCDWCDHKSKCPAQQGVSEY